MLKPRPKPKVKNSDSPAITQCVSATGKIFTIGDKIQILNPLGKFVTATITNFYRDSLGQLWATFKPLEKDPDCPWQRGCLRQELLKDPLN